MKEKYYVRLLESEDVELYKSIRLEALQRDADKFGSSHEEEEFLSDEEFMSSLRRIDIFGLFCDDRIIGSVGFERFSLKKMSHNGELLGMYVTKEHRGKGANVILLNAAIEHARPKVLQLYAYCISNNPTAMKFYEKHGFVTRGVNPRSFKIDDKLYDTNIMILSFDQNLT